MDEEFKKDLDMIIKEKINQLIQMFQDEKEIIVKGISAKIKTKSVETVLNKYNINDFEIGLDYDGFWQVKYLYKGTEIEPKGYYVLPKNYKEAGLLDIFKECQKQDTYKPDITHLQINSKIQ